MSCYIGGAFRQADIENWTTGNKFASQALEIMHAHPSYDAYWRDFDTSLKFAQMNVPAVHVGGWFDMFAQATIDEFVGRQHAGANGACGTQKLIMGPWTHGIGQMPVGDLTFPKAELSKYFLIYIAAKERKEHESGKDAGSHLPCVLCVLSRPTAATPSHLYLLLSCPIEVAPGQVALGFLNNLAYVHGLQAIYQFGGFIATVGEYTTSALRSETPLHGGKLRGGEERR